MSEAARRILGVDIGAFQKRERRGCSGKKSFFFHFLKLRKFVAASGEQGPAMTRGDSHGLGDLRVMLLDHVEAKKNLPLLTGQCQEAGFSA